MKVLTQFEARVVRKGLGAFKVNTLM